MRLIDRLRDKTEQVKCQHEELLNILRLNDFPIINIQNVVEYVIQDASTFAQYTRREALICCRPPFDLCWMESGFFGFLKGASPVEEMGALVFFQDGLLGALFAISFKEGVIFDHLSATVTLDLDGTPLTSITPRVSQTFQEICSSMSWPSESERAFSEIGAPKESFPFLIAAAAMNICNVASSFMSCKNVQLIENQAPRHERRQREREKKPPLTKYYTLEIEPMKKILRTEGKSKEVGLKKALHICRGHFAHYTPDKPLFGKVSGRFWIPAHVRGSKEAGEIKKDYRVLSPKGETNNENNVDLFRREPRHKSEPRTARAPVGVSEPSG